VTLEFILRVVGTEFCVDWHRAVGLTFAANTFFVAIAQFGGRGSSPKNTADLSQSAAEEQSALEKRNHLTGAIAFLRNHFRVKQAQTPDYLTERNQPPQENNQHLINEVAAFQKK
jgi:hypothetical protein